MKLKSTTFLPENIFELQENNLPKESDSDPWGKVMVYKKDTGWSVIDVNSVYAFYKHLNHTHWTFTPEKFND